MQLPNNLATEMSILGVGSDICHIPRIETLYNKFQSKFLARIYTPEEHDFLKGLPKAKQIPFLAKRFAAKEAFSKALQTGIGQYAHFTEISCIHDDNKAPYINLSGNAYQSALLKARENGFQSFKTYISLSDEHEYAQAFVILAGHNEIF